LFLGGGGGGGQENNNVGTNGGAGGGIIIIKADSILVSGTCAGRTISANGASTTNASNDGAGGAGAGGSIFLDVDGIRVASSCPLTISSNGGAGGRSNNGTNHGGGGGGGQGVVIITAAGPITNTTVQTNIGAGGCNNSSTPCSSAAGSGAGSNNSGVSFGNASGPLPVELLFFNAYAQSGNVALSWATASEQNCSHFIVYKSRDGILWTPIAYKQGAGNSNHRIDYIDYDNDPAIGVNYYRLEQHDYDGTTALSTIAVVYFEPEDEIQISVFPNPANELLNIRFDGNINVESLECFDVTGRIVSIENLMQQSNQFTIDTHQLEAGNYFLRLTYGTKVKTISFMVTHE
jgi:hypothetical protein